MKAHVGRQVSASRIEIELRAAHTVPWEAIRGDRLIEIDLVVAGESRVGPPALSSGTKHERGSYLLELCDLIVERQGTLKVAARHEVDLPLPCRANDANVQRQAVTFRERGGTEARCERSC